MCCAIRAKRRKPPNLTVLNCPEFGPSRKRRAVFVGGRKRKALDRLDHSLGPKKLAVPDRPASGGDTRCGRGEMAELAGIRTAAYQAAEM